ncbi:MAG: DUF4249 domain-containing protein [Dysgonamonadaceae bacterium]|jgi:hypothetical protein|nr:DUF4249 domain-containing protein [Dysgonamonadaceae bacterium]
MKKWDFLHIIFGVIAFLTGFSCTERIDLPTKDSPPVIVVYGLISDDSDYQGISVSRSSPYFDDLPNEGVSGAEVMVSTSDGRQINFTENDSIKGFYFFNRRFDVTGDTEYSLSVKTDFDGDGSLDVYEAKTEALTTQQGDSLTLEVMDMFGTTSYLLHLYLTDTEGDDYYLFNVFCNDSLLNGSISSAVVTDDKMFPNQQIRLNLYHFGDYLTKDDNPDYMQENMVYIKSGDTLEVRFCRITKEYFDFITQCQNEKGGENPLFGGPASNITTNIGNGGVGFFAVCKFQKMKIKFIKQE